MTEWLGGALQKLIGGFDSLQGLMKKCSKCQLEKDESEFYFKNKKLNKRHSQCKKCSESNRKSKEHYDKYKSQYIERNRKRRERLINENTISLIEFLKKHPCVDCGEKNPIVLEFDHRDEKEKSYTISKKMRYYKWETILKEIDKCDVRCSNCHKIRTAKQFGWRKYLLLNYK